MYCRTCGNQVLPAAEICVRCGVRPLNGKSFCQECGVSTRPDQELCIRCGVRLKCGGGKDWLVALLLCIFLGYLGMHRFYTGHVALGIIQLLTGGGCGIWWLIDLIMIIIGSYKDVRGETLVRGRC